MNDAKNGGPAFPHPGGSRDSTVQESYLGMDLRDWFAGQALCITQFACDSESPDNSDCNAEAHARQAYKIADAMLAEREKAR